MALHRMTLHNARMGVVHELVMERTTGGWQARWRTLTHTGNAVPGAACGVQSGPEPDLLFRRVVRSIEEADEDVMGGDWAFEAPLPPWLTD
jgi:hypothetical protein